MQVLIRRATVKDAAALATLSRDTFFETFKGTCTDDDMQGFLEEYFNIEQVKRELADKNDFYFFGEIDGIPAGYIRMMEDYRNFDLMKKWKALELKRIYVDKNFHGKGVAQQMMNFVESFAKENKYEVIWLGVWEHNLRAKRFYEKYGFVDSGHMHAFPIGSTPQFDNWLWKFLN
jgi:diamine N-acetyltransferase